jgi:hypothetical protein
MHLKIFRKLNKLNKAMVIKWFYIERKLKIINDKKWSNYGTILTYNDLSTMEK